MSINGVAVPRDIKQASAKSIAYLSTEFFSKLVADYLSGDEKLKPFYKYSVNIEGIRASIQSRNTFNTDRQLLVNAFRKQYDGIELNDRQNDNLEALLNNNTYTITTAHQPNIFTGPLYFIYKILHVIKLADELKIKLPEYSFVPVYYMGSEDADLDELGYLNISGEKLSWETNQKGAVGRMKVDKALQKIIENIQGQIGIHPYGNELIELFKRCYSLGKTVQQATLELVNALFADYGLLVVVPDNATLKASFNAVIKKELTEQFSNKAVTETLTALNKHYKAQASGRAINLFYLIDDNRERIEVENSGFKVEALDKYWSMGEILEELENHPERFSANVILRGVFQETILPNIAFVGGGGELAYWLELKKVFEAVEVPYPMLILRNSFLLVNEKQSERIEKLGFSIEDFFKSELEIINELVKKNSTNKLSFKTEIAQIQALYQQIKQDSILVDATLGIHVDSLQNAAINRLEELEKKVLRAEKRKFGHQKDQISHLKAVLFPNNNLQERIDNFSIHYSIEGKEWLKTLFRFSEGLKQEFSVITH